MPAKTDLVARSVDLKKALFAFMREPRFDRALRRALDQRFGNPVVADEDELANFFDYFMLQERLPGGRTVLESFVEAHPELPEEERTMLLGWHDVVESIFEVERQEGEALIAVNLLDEMTYRIRANVGPHVFRPMRPGSFVLTRLVPVEDEWLMSGIATLQPAASRDSVYGLLPQMAAQAPHLVFRNPEKLEQAWEAQRIERGHFIAYFGGDEFVLPGQELPARMRAYYHYRSHEARDEDGTTAAERALELYGVVPPTPDIQYPRELTRARSVGVIFDEVEGMNYCIDYGQLAEIFANPALAARREHQKVVQTYLRDRSLSPMPLQRLAERDPGKASRVYQQVLKQSKFSWERDGEALLRRYKASWFERRPLPSLTLVSERFTRAHLAAAAAAESKPERSPRERWLKRR